MKNRILLKIVSLSIFLFFSIQNTFSQTTYTFNNSTGDGLWFTAANWTNNARPPYATSTTDIVVITANCVNSNAGEFVVRGSLSVNSGVSLSFANGGSIRVASGATLTNNGTLSAQVDNYGIVTIEGSLSNPARLIGFQLGYRAFTGATLNLNQYGTLEYRQNITAIIPAGTFNWNTDGALSIGASYTFTLGSNFRVESGKKLEILGSMTVNSGMTLTNNGTIDVHTLTNNGTIVNNGLIPTSTSGTLFNNGILSGTGSQACALSNAGILSPGGTDRVCYTFTGGNVNYTNGSINLDIFGTTPCNNGSGHDQIVNAGVVNVAGVLNLNFGSYIPPANTTFQLFQITGGATTYTGNFSSINVTPNTIQVSYNSNTGVLSIVDPCPAPQFLLVDYETLQDSQAIVSWSPVTGATDYQIQYKKTAATNWSAPYAIAEISASLTNLDPYSEYEFQIQTSCDGGSSYGAWSASQVFTTNFGTVQNGNWNDPATWASGAIPMTNTDRANIRHAVVVNIATAICGNLRADNGTISIATGNTLTVGAINLVNNSGGDSKALLFNTTLDITGGSLNIGGRLYMSGSTFNMSTGFINLNGGGNPFMQTFGISTSTLFIDDDVTTNLTGGTITIYPPDFSNSSPMVETNKELGNFNTCVGPTVILMPNGTYNLGTLNTVNNFTFSPKFFNLILRGQTTNISNIIVKNLLTVDGGTLTVTNGSSIGAVSQLNSPTITGSYTTTGSCSANTTITSAQDGNWQKGSTWVGGVVPTTDDNVVIAHNVTNENNIANCKALTINTNSNLYQNDRLIIGGNLTVNGSFYHNFNVGTTATLATQIGASSIADPAGTRLVTVNGTLSLGSNLLGGGFYLAGRMVFNAGSAFVLGNYSNLTLTGWSGTPHQYLMDISSTTTLNLSPFYSTINLTRNNSGQSIIPLDRNFLSDVPNACATYPFLPDGDLGSHVKLADNNIFSFEGATRQSIQGMATGQGSLVIMSRKTFRSFSAIHDNSVNATECEFSRLIAGNGTTLHGDYTIINDCGSTTPYFSSVVNTYNNPNDFLNIDPDVNFKVNVTDSAIINVRAATTLNMAGTFTAQSGKMILKGGTFNLGTTTVSGLDNTRFFITKTGESNYFGSGKLQLPITSAAKKFDVGINLPTTTTNVYTPLSITSNSGATTAKVNLSTFDNIPSGFLAPNVKWTIETDATDATVIFTWQSSIETSAFAARRMANAAKVYRFDGVNWAEVSSSAVTTTADGFSITAANLTTLGTFAVMATEPGPISSAQTGNWNEATTWVNGQIPTVNDDVIILAMHTVTNGGTSPATANCKNLTINGGGKLNQSNQLNIGGNLTVLANGVFDNNPTNQYYPFSNTNIGTLDAFGNLTAADDKLVTVSGTLRLGYNNSSLTLGGRIVFNTGSTFSLEGPLSLKGWSGSTTQYLLDIDNLTNLNLPNGNTAEIYLPTYANGNIQRAISTGRSLATPCRSLPSALVRMGSNNWFGSNTAARQVIRSVMINNSLPAINVNFENTGIGNSIFQNVNVHSNNSEFSDFSISAGTNLFGDYTMVNHCDGTMPTLWASAAFDASNISSFNINATDSAVLRLMGTQVIGGSFKIQNGIVIVKNGTLDLHNTNVTGLSNTRYFITKSGGAVLLPALGNTPVTFNLGLGIPNGINPPTNVFAPLNIISNIPTTNTDITISLETLSVPSGYIAPTIQWNITPITMSGVAPNLKITFTWPASAASTTFNNRVNQARVHHYNSSTMTWEILQPQDPANPVQYNSDGSFSITVDNITAFSPFAVMIPTSVLSVELMQFSVNAKDNQAILNWQTASEINVKNFVIEKSSDGQKFEKIAEVNAHNTPSVHQAFDNQFSESSYYRLKINDLDGTSSFSKTVFLEKNETKSIKISRNTEGGIFIETDDIIESVIITNNIGQVLKTTKDNRFGLTDLPTGIYIISVKTNKSFVSQKILNF